MSGLTERMTPENFNNTVREILDGKKDHLFAEVLSYYEFMLEQGKVYPDILYKTVIFYLYTNNVSQAEINFEKLFSINNSYERYVMLHDFLKDPAKQNSNNSIPELADELSPFVKSIIDEFGTFYIDKPFYYEDVFLITGNYLLDMADYDEAFFYYLMAYAYGKSTDKFFYAIGYLCYKKGDMECAYHYLAHSISFNSRNVTALLDLSHVAIELGNREASFEALKKASELYPNYADIAYRMAQFYFEDNDFDQAKKFLYRAITINPMYTVANITYFYVLFKLSDQQEIGAFINSMHDEQLKVEFDFLFMLRFDPSLDGTVKKLCDIEAYEQKLLEGVWDRFLFLIPVERYAAFFEALLNTDIIDLAAYKILKGRFQN